MREEMTQQTWEDVNCKGSKLVICPVRFFPWGLHIKLTKDRLTEEKDLFVYTWQQAKEVAAFLNGFTERLIHRT